MYGQIIYIFIKENKISCCCSVTKSCLTPCNPTGCSMPGFPVLHCSLLKFTSIQSVIPSNHLILCCPFLILPSIFPAFGSFPMSQIITSGGQSIGAPASASVVSMNIQHWFPLWLTGLISLLSKGLSIVFSSTTGWKYQFFGAQLSLWPNSPIHTCLLENS